MKRKGSRILQMALTAALSFTWLMGSWGTSVTGLAEGIRADGDWYYLYGDFSGRYFKMSPKSETLWRYTDADTFAQVEIGQQNIVNLHPGNFGNTIKAWRAPADGTVSLKGSVKLLSDPRAAGSDSINGIRFSLLKRTFDGKNYGPAQAVDQTWDDVLLNDPTPVDFTVDDIDVCAGDLIALSVNNNGCNDSDGCSFAHKMQKICAQNAKRRGIRFVRNPRLFCILLRNASQPAGMKMYFNEGLNGIYRAFFHDVFPLSRGILLIIVLGHAAHFLYEIADIVRATR